MMVVQATCASGLFEFDQSAAEILRVQEQHRLAMGSDFGLAVAEDARALPFQAVARRDDVVDLIADMVDAAVGIALEKFRNRRPLTEWFQKLDLCIGKCNEHRGHAVIRLRYRGRDLSSERIAVDMRRLADIAHGDGDVVEPSDHAGILLRARQCKLYFKISIPSAHGQDTKASCPSVP